jgi:hypothetical protein
VCTAAALIRRRIFTAISVRIINNLRTFLLDNPGFANASSFYPAADTRWAVNVLWRRQKPISLIVKTESQKSCINKALDKIVL